MALIEVKASRNDQPLPVVVEVGECLAEGTARHNLRSKFNRPGAQSVQHGHALSVPRGQARLWRDVTDAVLDRLEKSDEAKRLQWPPR